jgi:hypothetical protein
MKQMGRDSYSMRSAKRKMGPADFSPDMWAGHYGNARMCHP